jgi:hypothetical protein
MQAVGKAKAKGEGRRGGERGGWLDSKVLHGLGTFALIQTGYIGVGFQTRFGLIQARHVKIYFKPSVSPGYAAVSKRVAGRGEIDRGPTPHRLTVQHHLPRQERRKEESDQTPLEEGQEMALHFLSYSTFHSKDDIFKKFTMYLCAGRFLNSPVVGSTLRITILKLESCLNFESVPVCVLGAFESVQW